jgi:hypothetical protein
MNAKLLFYDNESECDICDSKNKVSAHIQDVIGNVHIFCVECLNKIVIESPSYIELIK